MFKEGRDNLMNIKNVLVDGGYTGDEFATAVNEILDAKVEVAKRN